MPSVIGIAPAIAVRAALSKARREQPAPDTSCQQLADASDGRGQIEAPLN
jgi:hypothetical protein